jgi:hypothetical protein
MHTGEALLMNYGSGAAKLATLSTEDSGHPKLLHVDIRVDISGRSVPGWLDHRSASERAIMLRPGIGA